MKIMSAGADEKTYNIELTEEELRLIYLVLNEVRDGPNAIDDKDWDMLIGLPRTLESDLLREFDTLFEIE